MGLIVLMIDGVSADTFARERGRMPHVDALARRGLEVTRLSAEVPGTSLPGRASILTGATSDVSGVYGNMVWDGTAFRYANPDDVRVDTLPARARHAGLRSASIGMGMVRPEACDLFMRPWWVGAFLQRARDADPQPADEAWARVARHSDATVERAAAAAGVPTTFDPVPTDPTDRALVGFQGDQRVAQWVGSLAARGDGPDLIVAEFLMPDSVQHRTGYGSDAALWSISVADALVGDVMARLRSAGREDAYDVVVLSDHGHGPVEWALRPDVLLPGARFQSEGGLLHVAPRDAAEAGRIAAVLAEHDVVPFTTQHIPTDRRGELLAFLAPDGITFEHDAAVPADGPRARPVNRSSHGARPGHPNDDRFLVAAGPSVTPGRVERAPAASVAPTLAALLGLDLAPFPGSPLVEHAGRPVHA